MVGRVYIRVSQGDCLLGVSPFCPKAVEGAEWSADGEYPEAPYRLADDECDGHDDDSFGACEESGCSFVAEAFGSGTDVADHYGADECDECEDDGVLAEGFGR